MLNSITEIGRKGLFGAKSSGLPAERPTRFPLFINLKAAKALGLDMPLARLDQADKMID
jgi:putative ABC transport system substrate-binding protein